jgi:hypothetical protein
MEKQLEIPGKMKKPNQPSRPSLAQPGHAPASPDRWVPPVSDGSLPRALSLSLSLPSGAGLSSPVAFARAPLSPSASRAHLVSASNRYPPPPPTPTRPLSLSRCAMGPPYQLRLPRARPRRPPTHPSSFFSTTCARTRFPVPFCTALLSLALCPRHSTSLMTRARRVRRPARRKPRQATPSSAPR